MHVVRMVVTVVIICSKTTLQSAVNNSCVAIIFSSSPTWKDNTPVFVTDKKISHQKNKFIWFMIDTSSLIWPENKCPLFLTDISVTIPTVNLTHRRGTPCSCMSVSLVLQNDAYIYNHYSHQITFNLICRFSSFNFSIISSWAFFLRSCFLLLNPVKYSLQQQQNIILCTLTSLVSAH